MAKATANTLFETLKLVRETGKVVHLRLFWDESGSIYQGWGTDNGENFQSFAEGVTMLKALLEKKVSVVLNEDYTAEVSAHGIQVGCQTFPLSIVQKLVDATAQVSRAGKKVRFRDMLVGEKGVYSDSGKDSTVYTKTGANKLKYKIDRNTTTINYNHQDAYFTIVE